LNQKYKGKFIFLPDQIKRNGHQNIENRPGGAKYPIGRIKRSFFDSFVPIVDLGHSRSRTKKTGKKDEEEGIY